MLRRTVTIFFLIGLLLSAGLWGASYWDVFWKRKDQKLVLILRRSSLFIQSCPRPMQGSLDVGVEVRGYVGLGRTEFRLPRYESRMGVPKGIPGRFVTVIGPIASETTVPLWIACLAFAALPAYFELSRRHRRRQREKLGLCLKCGYDLRGSKDVCPECGNEFRGSGSNCRTLGDDGA